MTMPECFKDPNKGTKKDKQKSSKKKGTRGANRTRNWTFIVYPESVAEGWVDTLRDTHLEIFISPVHDKDKNGDGSLKKAHHHVVVFYDSVKSYDQVQKLSDSIGGTKVEKVASKRGVVRYLCHLDNPEKAQYDEKDVICLSGAQYRKIVNNETDRQVILREIINYVMNEGVVYFHELMIYIDSQDRDDWFSVLSTSGAAVGMVKETMRSMEYKWKMEGGNDIA